MSARILRFPTDRSLGEVLIQKPPALRRVSTLPACGDVEVPDGHTAALFCEPRCSLEPLRDLEPDALVRVVLADARFGDDDVAPIAHLRELRQLVIARTRIGDAGLMHIAALEGLWSLNVSNTRITSAGLGAVSNRVTNLVADGPMLDDTAAPLIAAFSSLSWLSLTASRISDATLAALRRLPLESIHLSRTAVTDAGIAALASIATLRELNLSHTKVTAEGLAREAPQGVAVYATLSEEDEARLRSSRPDLIVNGIRRS